MIRRFTSGPKPSERALFIHVVKTLVFFGAVVHILRHQNVKGWSLLLQKQ